MMQHDEKRIIMINHEKGRYMKKIEEYSKIINEAIARIKYTGPHELYAPIAYTMEGAGKRLRPVLTLAVVDALNEGNGIAPETGYRPGAPSCPLSVAISPALAVELYHNFTLLHDDIMDNSPTRRGRLAVWKKWNTAQAILSGDTMLSVALKHILDSDIDDVMKLHLVNCFNNTAIAVDHGQQLDMEFEHAGRVSLDDYLKMISLKTGALMAGACEMGAIMGGADKDARKSFADYGIYLGIAFQIQDDILDVYGNEATLGKPIGGDILNDKHTWLHIIAAKEASEDMSKISHSGINGREKIDAVRVVYDRLHLQQRSGSEVEKYLDKAVKSLDNIDISDDARQFFINFAHSLIGRVK